MAQTRINRRNQAYKDLQKEYCSQKGYQLQKTKKGTNFVSSEQSTMNKGDEIREAGENFESHLEVWILF